MHGQLPRSAQKILLNLCGGKILQFVRSPRGYFRISKGANDEWRKFNRRTLFFSLYRLHTEKLINIQEGLDGIVEIGISPLGKSIAEKLRAEASKPAVMREWDQRWRLVLFDIPEQKKNLREALRYHLRRMGFREFQRSVFLFPFACAKEIDALAERLNLVGHIRLVTAESISDEFRFKKEFNLL